MRERAPRIAYLGSPGSFTEEAARRYAERLGHAVELHGAPAPAAVLERLARGGCDLAVLPVANSCGGLVWTTLAALGGRGLELVDEVLVPVRFALFAARNGLGLADIERVASHPQAFRQCERTLARLLPGRETIPGATPPRPRATSLPGSSTSGRPCSPPRTPASASAWRCSPRTSTTSPTTAPSSPSCAARAGRCWTEGET